MFTVIDSAFDRTILTHPGIFRAAPAASVQPRRRAAAKRAVPPTPPSLWRRALNEETEGRAHRLCVRAFCAVAGLLGVGSVGYAGWRVWALLGDERLHDAVAAFAR